MLHRQDAERLAGAGFEEQRIFHLPERAQRIVESRGVIQVPRPICRIRRVGLGNPVAGYIRDKRDLRRIQANLSHFTFKFTDDRIEQPRMKRMRVLHGAESDAAHGECALEFHDSGWRPGYDAEARAIDERDGKVAGEQRLKFGFRQRHREHPRGRERRDELCAPHDEMERIFE